LIHPHAKTTTKHLEEHRHTHFSLKGYVWGIKRMSITAPSELVRFVLVAAFIASSIALVV
jgi:hypothetical protein